MRDDLAVLRDGQVRAVRTGDERSGVCGNGGGGTRTARAFTARTSMTAARSRERSRSRWRRALPRPDGVRARKNP
ncbi:MAG: hypothetical protein ACLR4Z_15165 [Butyricicoccaceae bacterium]